MQWKKLEDHEHNTNILLMNAFEIEQLKTKTNSRKLYVNLALDLYFFLHQSQLLNSLRSIHHQISIADPISWSTKNKKTTLTN
jgi:hypothetical protein